MNLTLRRIGFWFPLLSKSDTLGVVANGTVPLSLFPDSIRSIKRMAKFAHGFSFVDSAKGVRILKRIFFHSYKPQMSYRDTAPVSADMVNHHSFGDRAVKGKVRNSVRSPSFLSKVERTVSVFIERALPQSAFSLCPPLAVESFKLFRGQVFHVGHITPFFSLANR